jgi:2,4-dienoyl-CoA reductase-like NADH-dependent reductase (Old Yellow Enzyme family)
MPALFRPLTIGGTTLRNRILMSPMCQYSAVDGAPTEWHFVHLGRYAAAGLGLVMTEATHVAAEARITPGCLGLWTDAHESALARILRFLRGIDPELRAGVQLAHAGRKGATDLPWRGGKPLAAGAWETVAPSAIPHDEGWPAPRALDAGELPAIAAQFAAAAARALRAGFDVVELHAAHGYLLHEFLSPFSNRREDGYGGTRAKRMRFPLEVAAAVRAVWPRERALGMRITGSDHIGEAGLTAEDAAAFASELKSIGLDFVDVSSGGISMKQKIALGPGYQVPLARRVRAESGLTTIAVGMILEGPQAERIVAEGDADAVMLARALLNDPLWAWRAADALGGTVFCPPQYLRGRRVGVEVPRDTVVPAAASAAPLPPLRATAAPDARG